MRKGERPLELEGCNPRPESGQIVLALDDLGNLGKIQRGRAAALPLWIPHRLCAPLLDAGHANRDAYFFFFFFDFFTRNERLSFAFEEIPSN